jgi:hypothetical protein
MKILISERQYKLLSEKFLSGEINDEDFYKENIVTEQPNVSFGRSDVQNQPTSVSTETVLSNKPAFFNWLNSNFPDVIRKYGIYSPDYLNSSNVYNITQEYAPSSIGLPLKVGVSYNKYLQNQRFVQQGKEIAANQPQQKQLTFDPKSMGANLSTTQLANLTSGQKQNKEEEVPQLISGGPQDSYDYYKKSGRYYTRKKGTQQWIDVTGTESGKSIAKNIFKDFDLTVSPDDFVKASSYNNDISSQGVSASGYVEKLDQEEEAKRKQLGRISQEYQSQKAGQSNKFVAARDVLDPENVNQDYTTTQLLNSFYTKYGRMPTKEDFSKAEPSDDYNVVKDWLLWAVSFFGPQGKMAEKTIRGVDTAVAGYDLYTTMESKPNDYLAILGKGVSFITKIMKIVNIPKIEVGFLSNYIKIIVDFFSGTAIGQVINKIVSKGQAVNEFYLKQPTSVKMLLSLLAIGFGKVIDWILGFIINNLLTPIVDIIRTGMPKFAAMLDTIISYMSKLQKLIKIAKLINDEADSEGLFKLKQISVKESLRLNINLLLSDEEFTSQYPRTSKLSVYPYPKIVDV